MTQQPRMIVAIDGPAGAGKSTVCRMLAKRLGYVYLDTGAMYRAIAWALRQEDSSSSRSAEEMLPSLPLRFAIEGEALSITYKGVRLDEELRRPEISQEASRVSRIAAVREYLTRQQRELAAAGGIVAEGRDMTTVVFPNARVKVFLTADLPTRARRRFEEYVKKGVAVDYAVVEKDMQERDEADRSREIAPLRPAADALMLDTSGLDIEQVVSRLTEHIDRVYSQSS